MKAKTKKPFLWIVCGVLLAFALLGGMAWQTASRGDRFVRETLPAMVKD